MCSKYLSGYITDENVAPQLEHKIDRLIRCIEKLESLVDINKEMELLDIHNAMEKKRKKCIRNNIFKAL